MIHAERYIQDSQKILSEIDLNSIENMIQLILLTKSEGGRIFFLGVGGGASHASHAVCDFRKLAKIEAYSPADNMSEVTATTNDDGWEKTYVQWLQTSKVNSKDLVFVISVGGGDQKHNISMNIVNALHYAKETGAKITGITGRKNGHTAQVANASVVIPSVNPTLLTALTESFQAWVWHLIISDPRIQEVDMKWESTS